MRILENTKTLLDLHYFEMAPFSLLAKIKENLRSLLHYSPFFFKYKSACL